MTNAKQNNQTVSEEIDNLSSYKKITELEARYFDIQEAQQQIKLRDWELQQKLDNLSTQMHYAREEYKKDYSRITNRRERLA